MPAATSCTATYSGQQTELLWSRYRQSHEQELRNQLVVLYLPIVRKIAFKLYRGAWGIDSPDELVNEGIIALISSIDRFDPSRNVKFETFVSRRVQGAMTDYLYKQSGYVRRVHELSKKVAAARLALTEQLRREPTPAEMAGQMEISAEEYDRILLQISSVTTVSIDQMGQETEGGELPQMELPAGQSDPAEILDKKEYGEELACEIRKLSREQQLVLSLFYKEDFSVREIAETLHMKPEQVSQIRFQSIKKLKKMLGNQLPA